MIKTRQAYSRSTKSFSGFLIVLDWHFWLLDAKQSRKQTFSLRSYASCDSQTCFCTGGVEGFSNRRNQLTSHQKAWDIRSKEKTCFLFLFFQLYLQYKKLRIFELSLAWERTDESSAVEVHNQETALTIWCGAVSWPNTEHRRHSWLDAGWEMISSETLIPT